MTCMDKRDLGERDVCTMFVTPALRRTGRDEAEDTRNGDRANRMKHRAESLTDMTAGYMLSSVERLRRPMELIAKYL